MKIPMKLIAGLLSMIFSGSIMADTGDRLLFWGINQVSVARTTSKLVLDPLIAADVLKNIVSVSSAGDMLSLVALDKQDLNSGLSLFLFDVSHRDLKWIQQIPGLTKAALSPQKSALALTVCSSGGCNLEILNLSTRHRSTVAKNIRASGSVSWDSQGGRIAFETQNKVIKVLSLATGTELFTIEGSAPSWSPDSSKIAFFEDKDLLLYEVNSQKKTKLYKRHFWQTEFTGEIYWRGDGLKLAWNVPAGITGYEFECLSLDLLTNKNRTLYTGYNRCGPWLSN